MFLVWCYLGWKEVRMKALFFLKKHMWEQTQQEADSKACWDPTTLCNIISISTEQASIIKIWVKWVLSVKLMSNTSWRMVSFSQWVRCGKVNTAHTPMHHYTNKINKKNKSPWTWPLVLPGGKSDAMVYPSRRMHFSPLLQWHQLKHWRPGRRLFILGVWFVSKCLPKAFCVGVVYQKSRSFVWNGKSPGASHTWFESGQDSNG